MRSSTTFALMAGTIASAHMIAPMPEISTAYLTEIETIHSCAPEITDCPYAHSSTVAPPAPESTTEAPLSSMPISMPPLVTSTIYATSVSTIISCAADVPDCPAGSTMISTVIVPISTTVCPYEGESSAPPPPPVYTSVPVVSSIPPPPVYSSIPVAESSVPVYSSAPVVSSIPAPPPVYSTMPVDTSIVPPPPAPPAGTAPAPYPVPVPSGPAPYPIPSGTAPTAPYGTASGTGTGVIPTNPAQFTGAASHAQVGMMAAGAGFLALFL
ncbi:hypothetical protein K402DRAFT_405341 [Aulographum hederae CBS 113979]|uniref:GPI anchored serine-rich protein n=1 Tax=Aulographum hederae CBS 113979 TaxID=1176131 RepID=A0A6G1GW92_9PEZI|nr:hypothetical protein K402DRAFT_405341 [Aulographum hederae CBS 113979]